MPPRSLSGVLAPVVTPFDGASGAVDQDAFVANLRSHLAAGLHGVVVAGSSGEAALLDEAERAALVAAARAEVPADRWLVSGIGGESTRVTMARAQAAAEAGADLVLVVSPHYYGKRMTDAALEAHFRAVADASPCPVLLYNIPVYAHLVLSPELVARLADHPNVVGMKDSAGDLPVLERYLARQADDFRVLTGSGQTFAPALAGGASGGILAVSLFAPALTLEVWSAMQGRDTARAELAQARLAPLAREIVAALGPAGLKHAMTLVGLAGGAPRAPLLPLAAEERAAVRQALETAGVLAAGAADVADAALAVPPGTFAAR